MFSHPDHLILLANAREHEFQRLAERQRFGTSDEAGWLSSGEEALFRYTLSMPLQEPGIFEAVHRIVAAAFTRAHEILGSRPPRNAAAEAVIGDGA
jgi:hypothetical protein